jgi:hypothetical protein
MKSKIVSRFSRANRRLILKDIYVYLRTVVKKFITCGCHPVLGYFRLSSISPETSGCFPRRIKPGITFPLTGGIIEALTDCELEVLHLMARFS